MSIGFLSVCALGCSFFKGILWLASFSWKCAFGHPKEENVFLSASSVSVRLCPFLWLLSISVYFCWFNLFLSVSAYFCPYVFFLYKCYYSHTFRESVSLGFGIFQKGELLFSSVGPLTLIYRH